MKKRLRFARPRRGLRVPSPRRSRRPAGSARGPPNAIATAARDSPGACGRNDPLKFPFSSCLPHDAQVQAGNCICGRHSRASRCGRGDAKCGELRIKLDRVRSNATNARERLPTDQEGILLRRIKVWLVIPECFYPVSGNARRRTFHFGSGQPHGRHRHAPE